MSASRRWAAAPGGICVRRDPYVQGQAVNVQGAPASWDVVATRLCDAVLAGPAVPQRERALRARPAASRGTSGPA